MKVRTLVELQDLLDREKSWRLKEIANIKQAAAASQFPGEKTVIRAGVTLLYAHWEGFVKQAATGYLTFVSSKRLRYQELSCPFVVFGAKGLIHDLASSRKARLNIQVVEFFVSKQSDRADLRFAGAIDTESNLSSAVFENIAASLGLDTSPYETKYNLIDESLLSRRNSIAHGEYLDLDSVSFRTLADEVISLMGTFKTDIENAATMKGYLRKTP